MKKTLAFLLLFVGGLCAYAQQIKRVEPLSWWTGIQNLHIVIKCLCLLFC